MESFVSRMRLKRYSLLYNVFLWLHIRESRRTLVHDGLMHGSSSNPICI